MGVAKSILVLLIGLVGLWLDRCSKDGRYDIVLEASCCDYLC